MVKVKSCGVVLDSVDFGRRIEMEVEGEGLKHCQIDLMLGRWNWMLMRKLGVRNGR